MKPFEYLQTTKIKKKKYYSNADEIYKKSKNIANIEALKLLNSENLQGLNIKHKRFNPELVDLWANLEMEKLIFSFQGTIINPYLSLDSINTLNDYYILSDESRFVNLLEIINVTDLKLDQIELKNLYLAIFETYDENKKLYRPYIEIFIKNEYNQIIKIGYGYDSNDNEAIELFIKNFNYPLFLLTNGTILLPLTNKKSKIKIYDSLDQMEIGKLNDFKTVE